MRRMLLAAVCVLSLTSAALAQAPSGRREIHTDSPELNGVRASAPIPPELHVHNEGGSDGSGLCVTSSAITNGLHQGVPDLNVPDADGNPGKGSLLWRVTKSRPGGSYPEKLAATIEETMPDEGYANILGKDPKDLQKMSDMGIPFGLTMSTGERYSWSRIAHMVSYLSFNWDQDVACYTDNNFPGEYTWITAREALRRATSPTGEYWAFCWTRHSIPGIPGGSDEEVVLVAAAVVVAVVIIKRRS